MAKGHNSSERKLLEDIRQKNNLRALLEDKLRTSAEWKREAETCKKRSKQKRYNASAARMDRDIECLKKEVLKRNEDLVKRIQEEIKGSEKEISDFRAQYVKEYEELVKAQEAEKAAGNFAKTSKELLRKIARAEKKTKKEGKDVEKVKAEISSEEKDAILLNSELKRATAELAHYGS